VVGDLAVKGNPKLVQREQARLLHGNCGTRDREEVHHALRFRNRLVNYARTSIPRDLQRYSRGNDGEPDPSNTITLVNNF